MCVYRYNYTYIIINDNTLWEYIEGKRMSKKKYNIYNYDNYTFDIAVISVLERIRITFQLIAIEAAK